MRMFIYGAGNYGQLLLEYMTSKKEKIDYFVQTEKPTVKEVKNIPVISFKEMLALDGKKTVFIAIANREIAKEIEHNILVADNENVIVWHYGGFINENLVGG